MQYTREDGCMAWLASGRLSYDCFSTLLEVFGSAENVYDALQKDGANALRDYVPSARLERLMTSSKKKAMHQLLVTMQTHHIGLLQQSDTHYPALLRHINDPPIVLFYQGNPDCLDGRCITMVGSRKASPAGVQATFKIARDLSAAGVTVVSGMAMGIDTAAHQGCLEGGSPTAAVLACGLDIDYPSENADLKRRLLEKGGVLFSEYPPGTPALGRHFPVRNRILSGVSKAVIMMECSPHSGSMHTVQHALDQGRDIYAYPGRIDTTWAKGAHQLLREGANYFTCADDILADMGWAEENRVKQETAKKVLPSLTDTQRKILQALAVEEKSCDQLAAETGLSATDLLTALTLLQLGGLVRPLPGKMYTKA